MFLQTVPTPWITFVLLPHYTSPGLRFFNGQSMDDRAIQNCVLVSVLVSLVRGRTRAMTEVPFTGVALPWKSVVLRGPLQTVDVAYGPRTPELRVYWLQIQLRTASYSSKTTADIVMWGKNEVAVVVYHQRMSRVPMKICICM